MLKEYEREEYLINLITNINEDKEIGFKALPSLGIKNGFPPDHIPNPE